jgi:hypothetical protein
MANFRSSRIHRIVVTEWPRVYDHLTLESERHQNDKVSGGGIIPAYTARYYVDAHTSEAALIVYLYDVPHTAPAAAPDEPEAVEVV